MYTWGDGSQGQLGHGDTDPRLKPELVKALAGKSITRYYGSQGQLGHGDIDPNLNLSRPW